MLRVFICVGSLLLFAGFAFTQPTVTWTGAGGDSRWDNPANWDAGAVPDEETRVVIPSGTPACLISSGAEAYTLANYGTMGAQSSVSGHVFITVHGDITNQGTMSTGNANLSVTSGTGTIQNSGTISGMNLNIHATDVVNQCGGVIQSSDGSSGMRIFGLNSVVNLGTVQAGNSSSQFTSGVGIETGTTSTAFVANAGTIAGGAGVSQGVDGGGVSIWTQTMNNSGTLKPGNGGPGGKDGKVNVFAKKINEGGTTGGSSGTRPELGDVSLVADTIIIPADSGVVLEGNEVRILGRAIIISFVTGYVYYEGSLDFCATADGCIDFSGMQAGHCIFGSGVSRIFSNNIVPPSQGLNYIFTTPPDTFPADTTIVGGGVSEEFSSAYAGDTDTLILRMQNQSTVSKVLNYSISSVRGWVTPFLGSTNLLSPFDFADLNVIFTIPGGTGIDIKDSVTAILTVGPSFTDTSYSEIACRGPVLGIADRLSYQVPSFQLECAPNPFNERVLIRYAVPKSANARLVIYNLLGQEVRTLISERLELISKIRGTNKPLIRLSLREVRPWMSADKIPAGLRAIEFCHTENLSKR